MLKYLQQKKDAIKKVNNKNPIYILIFTFLTINKASINPKTNSILQGENKTYKNGVFRIARDANEVQLKTTTDKTQKTTKKFQAFLEKKERLNNI